MANDGLDLSCLLLVPEVKYEISLKIGRICLMLVACIITEANALSAGNLQCTEFCFG